MSKNPKNRSGSNLLLMVVLGIVDVLCLAVLIVAMLLSPEKKSELQVETLPSFEENADTYGNYDTMESIAVKGTVSYISPTEPTTTAAPTEAASDDAKEEETSTVSRYDGFIFPNSHKELISWEDIENYANSKNRCQRAINEIYARHGFKFQKQSNRDFFNQYSWYVDLPKISDMDEVTHMLNDVEKANVDLLIDYEITYGWDD